ncbi:hypothetical protein FKM82_022320 [Ascaphus truei]
MAIWGATPLRPGHPLSPSTGRSLPLRFLTSKTAALLLELPLGLSSLLASPGYRSDAKELGRGPTASRTGLFLLLRVVRGGDEAAPR